MLDDAEIEPETLGLRLEDGDVELEADTDGDSDGEAEADGDKSPQTVPLNRTYRLIAPEIALRSAIGEAVTAVNAQTVVAESSTS